jgi:hypothetical protein
MERHKRTIAFAVLVVLRPAAGQEKATAPAIFEKVLAAHRDNRANSRYFVYREDVRYREEGRRDAALPRESTYEVTFVEGEPYHRWVAQNGEPLPAAQAATEERRLREVEEYRAKTPIEERRRRYFEAEENRFRFDLDLVMRHHELVLAGEEDLDGARVWVIDTRPKKGAPRPRLKSEWSLSQAYRLWIDQASYLPRQIRGSQLFDFLSTRKGAVTTFHYHPVEGVMLTDFIRSEAPRSNTGRRVVAVTEQRYSEYRRFQASSSLVFERPE